MLIMEAHTLLNNRYMYLKKDDIDFLLKLKKNTNMKMRVLDSCQSFNILLQYLFFEKGVTLYLN